MGAAEQSPAPVDDQADTQPASPALPVLTLIPWEELPLGATEAAALWKVSASHFLERIACRPDFPKRLQRKPAVWRAGDVVKYRNRQRA